LAGEANPGFDTPFGQGKPVRKALAYQELLRERGFIASMSRKGNCYDNACMESFFSTLKSELIYLTKFKTRAEARQTVFEYIEVYYNRIRLHSSLGYMSPCQYEQHLKQVAA